LLLDLTGAGIATVGLSAGLHFDHDGDGMKEATGWAAAGTGLLVLDRDGSGHLSNGNELFGDFTPVNGGIAVNGFVALAQYDRNHDGRIDAADPVWNELKVWRHLADPVTGETVIDDPDYAGELVGLDALGIVAIRLDAQGAAVQDASGNTCLRTAWLEMADGSLRAIAEYRLDTNAADATPQTLSYVDADTRALPELAGMGTVRDLHQAMQRDATLKGLVQQFAGATDAAQLDTLFTQIVYRWAGVDGLAANARGVELDARKVAGLEAFYGVELGRPTRNDAVPWDLTWRHLTEGFRASLMAQTHLAGAMAYVPLTTDDNGRVSGGDPSQAIGYFTERFATDPATARVELAEFARSMRGYGLGTSIEYLRLREAMIGFDASLNWVMDSAGLPAITVADINTRPYHREGTDFSEAMNAAAMSGIPSNRELLNSGNGDDVVYARDQVSDKTQGDHIIQESGNAILIGGVGDDWINAGDGDDILDGGVGNDCLLGESGQDVYIFRRGSGNDTIVEQFAGTNTIYLAGLTPANIVARRNAGNVVLTISDTGDSLTLKDYYGSKADFLVVFEDGSVWNLADADLSRTGTPWDDHLEGDASAEEIFGLAGNDTIYGLGGDDSLDGGDGNDTLVGGNGRDTLRGGAGDDEIFGGNTDVWNKDWEPLGNTILFSIGDGHDTVYAAKNIHGADTLQLGEGIVPADVSLLRTGNHLLVNLMSGETVALNDWFNGADGVGRIVFADGSVWEREALDAAPYVGTEENDVARGNAGDNVLYGMGGNDRLFGSSGNDTLSGGAGDDLLAGGDEEYPNRPARANGNDTYVFGRGAGHDVIIDRDVTQGNLDTLSLSVGIVPDDIMLNNHQGDLVVTIRDTGESVTVRGWYRGDEWQVERIVFADGTVWDAEAVRNRTRLEGTPAGDFLRGTVAAEMLLGYGDNDVLIGGGGDDVLQGGAGDDLLLGGAGDDNASNRDWITTSNGDDIYVFGRGDGNDILVDYDPIAGNRDTVRLGDGIVAADVSLRRRGSDLALMLDSGETLTMRDWFVSGRGVDVGCRIEQIAFADGTVWAEEDVITRIGQGSAGDDELYGWEGSQLMAGTAGNDLLAGGNGDDVYRFNFGDGRDTVLETDAENGFDVLELADGVVPGDVRLRRDANNHLVVSLGDGADTLTVLNWFSDDGPERRIDELRFADGTVWTEEEMLARVLLGGSEAEMLIGYDSDDLIDGGGGDDNLVGGRGNDTYRYASGDGWDRIQDAAGIDAIELGAGVAPADVAFSVEGYDLLISIGAGGLRVENFFFGGKIERLSFADGTVWTDTAILAMIPPSTDGVSIYGMPVDDILTGGDGRQEIHGLEGNDRLDGGAGDDVLIGGIGADTLLGGPGNDELHDGGDQNEEVSSVDYDADPDWLDGGPGDDKIVSGGGDTIVIGRGGGFDSVTVDVSHFLRLPGFAEQAQAELETLAAMSDSALWQSSYWVNHRDYSVYWAIPSTIESMLSSMSWGITVAEAREALGSLQAWLANDQTVRFGTGIRPQDLSVQFDPVDPGSTDNPNTVRLAIGFGDGEGLLIAFDWSSYFDISVEGWPTVAEGSVRHFVFDDGSEMTLEQILALADGGVIGDRWGADDGEDFSCSVVAEEIHAEGGADRISAKDGADYILAGDGDDLIAGGQGNDYVAGGPGMDVIAFNRGDGDDYLEADWDDGYDVISFGAGIAPADVSLRLDADGNLVFLVDGGDGGSLSLGCFDTYDWPPSDVPPVARLQFIGADGTARIFDFQALFAAKLTALLSGVPLPLADAATWEIVAAPAGGEAAVAYAQNGNMFGTAYFAGSNHATGGDDRLLAADGGASIDAGTGNDAVAGGSGDDMLAGGEGNDLVEGGSGADVLEGGPGDDVLRGGSGDDELSGGGGSDLAEGGPGADTYYFNLGDGTLAVREAEGMGDENALVFGAGIVVEDLVLTYADGVLTIAVGTSGDRVRLLDFDPDWAGSYPVGMVVFDDGNELSFGDLLARGFDLAGTDGDDLLVGSAFGDRIDGGQGDDLIVGGGGNDMLAGGLGDDVYVFNRGDGFDTIDDTGAAAQGDAIRFGEDIAVADLAFEFADGGLNIRVGGDTLRILGIGSLAAIGESPVQRLLFANGVTLLLDEVLGGGQTVQEGTPRDDTLQSDDAGARFVPLAGNDQMTGGLGDDTYVIAAGGGIDSIRDMARQGAGNTLVFDMAADLAAGLRLSHDPLAGTLDLSIAEAGSLVRLEDFDCNDPFGVHAIERFQLGRDGPTLTYAELIARGFDIVGGDGDDELLGTHATDRIEGGAGDDYITSGRGDDHVAGGAGNDTYVFNRGDGILTIDDMALAGEGNVLRFGAGIERAELERALRFVAPSAGERGQLIIRLGDSGDEVRLQGFDPADPEYGDHAVESFVFADGSSLSYRELLRETFVVQGDETSNSLAGTNVGDRLYGYEADDTLNAAGGDDVLTGGPGNDALYGGAGCDAYVFNRGDGIDVIEDTADAGGGNIIAFGDGIAADDLGFRMDGNTLVIAYGMGDEVRVSNYGAAAPVVDTLEFADGATLSLAAALNRAPEIVGLAGSAVFDEDAAGAYALPTELFADPEGGALTLAASLVDGNPLPSWLGFDAATGRFSGTPENVDVGELALRVTATDPLGAATHADFTLTVVNTNDAPVLVQMLENAQATEDVPFVLKLPIGLIADIDHGDRLAYSATLADGSPLPVWLVFDPAALVFSGTPANDDVGSIAIRLVATDQARATCDATFSIVVENVNDAPLAGTPLEDAAALKDAPFLYQLPADAFVDVDAGDDLSTSATLADGSPLPAWLNFDPYGGVFQGVPVDGDVGSYTVRVTARDTAGAAVTQDFVLTVTGGNDVPTPVADGFVLAEDEALTIATTTLLANDSDPDDPADMLSVTAVGNAVHGSVALDAVGQIVFVPEADYYGPANFAYTVSDSHGATADAMVGIDISSVNDAPTVGIPIAAQLAVEEEAFRFAMPAGTFVDVDAGDTVTLGAALVDGSPLPAWLAFDAAAGTFSGTPGNADVGVLSIRVTATDVSGESASQRFDLTVANVNDAPVVQGEVFGLAEDTSLVLDPTDLLANDSDPDLTGDVLTITSVGNAVGGTVTFADDNRIVFTPDANRNGLASFDYTVADGRGGQATATATLAIAPVNDAPYVVVALADQSARAGTEFAYALPADAFADVDAGDSLTLAASQADGTPLPAWLGFDPATGIFSGIPAGGNAGTYVIRVTATDAAGAAAAQDFSLIVEGGNLPPVAVPDYASVVEDQKLLAVGNVLANDRDPEGARLRLVDPGIRRTDYGMLYLERNGGYMYVLNNFAPAVQSLSEGQTISEVFAYQVSDREGSATGQLTVTIIGCNERPILRSHISDHAMAIGGHDRWSVAGCFQEVDQGDSLSYSARLADGGVLPTWLRFEAATGTFSGSAPANAKGYLDIKVTAFDGHGDDSAVSDVFRLQFGRRDNRQAEYANSWEEMTRRLEVHLQDDRLVLGGDGGGETRMGNPWDVDTYTLTSTSTVADYYQPARNTREGLTRLG
jgi:VCBS repeat-containing protein